MRWKAEVEKVARMAGLRNRKSLAFSEGIWGYCFALDNVGWVGHTFLALLFGNFDSAVKKNEIFALMSSPKDAFELKIRQTHLVVFWTI